MSALKDYVGIAHQYAHDVVTGKISACVYVKQACQRHLTDLSDLACNWTLDADQSNRACKFIEMLPHTQGQWARKQLKLVLEPWQIFIVVNIIGWVDSDGRRRYRYVYIEVPRKNGKSTLLAGIGLYLSFAEGEQGAQVYSAATTRDQARIVWEEAQRMVNRLPKMQKALGITPLAHSIVCHATNSTFKSLSRDQGGNQDGLNVHAALIDELHAHDSPAMYDVLESATGAREQPILLSITTAGFNLHGVCYRERQLVIDILAGKKHHDRYFGIIYSVDRDDDWTDPQTWKKANPNYDVSVSPEQLDAACQKAKEQPTAQTNFLTKHLCIWVSARSGWMNMRAWAECADETLTPEQFIADPCFIGLDLASKSDLAGDVKVFCRTAADDLMHFYIFSRQYINDEAANRPENRDYQTWARDGWLHITDGNVTDFAVIEQNLMDDAEKYDIKEVGFDPFNATYMAQRLDETGVNTVEVPQRVQYLSEAMKWIEALVKSKRIHHVNDPLFNWAMGNVTVKVDANDNIFPRKEAAQNKIDPIVALIIAMSRAINFEQVGIEDDSFDFDDFLTNMVSGRRK